MIIDKLVKYVAAGFLASAMLFAVVSMPVAASPNITVVAFGLFGAQSVFESEAKGAASIVGQRLGASPVIVRANTKTRGDLTIASINAALQSAVEHMDRENDVLFLILTSHGSPAGVAVQGGRREEILSPILLARILNHAGVRHRVVVISACYSGVFLGPLPPPGARRRDDRSSALKEYTALHSIKEARRGGSPRDQRTWFRSVLCSFVHAPNFVPISPEGVGQMSHSFLDP
jgi:hypothetical protein